MKKNGIINQELMAALTGLGHTSAFLLCDAGYSVPKGIQKIDLALVAGIPSFFECLNAILFEVVIEEITIPKQMEEYNEASFKRIIRMFQNQKKNIIDINDFVNKAVDVKFVVRSGELTPYSNIILSAASGVEQFKNNFVI